MTHSVAKFSPPSASGDPSPAYSQALLGHKRPQSQGSERGCTTQRPTLPGQLTQLSSPSHQIARKVEMAQMAQDLQLHELFSDVPTQAVPRWRSPTWADEREPKCRENYFQDSGFSMKNVNLAFNAVTFSILCHVSSYIQDTVCVVFQESATLAL